MKTRLVKIYDNIALFVTTKGNRVGKLNIKFIFLCYEEILITKKLRVTN